MCDAAALERHWLACMASAGGGGRVTRLAGAYVLTNPACRLTMLNCILLHAPAPERLEAILEAGRAVLAAHGRPPALFLSPLAGDEAAIAARLSALGWRCTLRQTVLVRDLDMELPGPSPGPEVEETFDLEEWGRLLVEAYEVPAPLGVEIRTAWTTLPGARYYLARIDGAPAGTGLTWQHGGIAGLYAGAVLPARRRQGVERATLLRRMADARRAGAALAVVQTEAGSPVEHLCRDRLGFRPVYQRALWTAAPAGRR